MKRGIGVFVLFAFSVAVQAKGIKDDLDHYFNAMGVSSNVTAPSSYAGQAAGFYSGGNAFVRSGVRDVQIMNIDLPSYRAGCGGIDLYMGGLSFINKKDFEHMSKNIINNAQGYVFNLALESVTPVVANTMKYLQDLSNKINQANINSCETAAGLVGSVWPRTQQAQRQVCVESSTKGGLFDDWASARQGCGAQGRMSEALANAKGPYKNLVLENTNIVWKAIMQNAFLKSDVELAELFMTLSGTVIFKNKEGTDDSEHTLTVLPSLTTNNDIVKALLIGGTTKVYRCEMDTPACLAPTLQSVTIGDQAALQHQVFTLLQSMLEKIKTDEALTPREIGLLGSTRLPVYKMLAVQAAFAPHAQKNAAVLNVTDYADVIAQDLLQYYLSDILQLVKTSLLNLQMPTDEKRALDEGMQKALDGVRHAHQNAYQKNTLSMQLVQQTKTVEQLLASQLSSELSRSLTWANGLH